MTRVRIHLTGQARVEGDDAVVDGSRLRGERARLVFAYLVLQRARPLTRDELADAIWGEALPPTWRPALRTVLSRVRAFLAGAGSGAQLVADQAGCYRLRWPNDDVEVDLEQMARWVADARTALEAGNRSAARELAVAARDVALRPFLPGLEGAWIDDVRTRQRHALEAGLRLMGEAALADDPSEAVDLARELIELDAVSEQGYRLLMLAHVARGNRAEALTAYMACRAALVEELGVEPSAETQETYLAILRSPEGAEDLHRARTRFVDIGGARIAYQTAGSGQLDVVFVAGSFIHVDTIWHDAAPAAFFSRFLPAARLVFFDPAGTGASDDLPAEDAADIAARRSDELRGVLDAARVHRAAIVASLDGGPAALRFAATRPDRVQALVLVNTTARWVRAAGYEAGLPPAAAEAIVDRVAATWGTEEFAAHVYPGLRSDERFLAWYARLQRTMTSPRAAALALRRLQAVDERPVLPLISAPTLVLHRRRHPAFPLPQGRYLATHIPGASLQVLEGSEGLFAEDSEAIAGRILEFALSTAVATERG